MKKFIQLWIINPIKVLILALWMLTIGTGIFTIDWLIYDYDIAKEAWASHFKKVMRFLRF